MPHIFERSRASTVGTYVLAVPFLALIVLFWVTAFRRGTAADAILPALATVVVLLAMVWHGGVTTSRIELYDDGRLRLCARWRTVETEVSAVTAIEVPVPRKLNTRVKLQFADGRAFWMHAADFPGFPWFAARLIWMNPAIATIRIPEHWLPSLDPPSTPVVDEIR